MPGVEAVARPTVEPPASAVRILIVKTSSLGDVVHALPVIDDIVAARPGAVVDWVVEEALAELPTLHPAVRRSIPVAVRRWRRAPFSGRTRAEIRRFDAAVGTRPYDFVVDLQGLVKSAWIVSRVPGWRCGYDWQSAREPLASLAYARRFGVSRALHAVERNRRLAAASLGYALHGGPSATLRLGAIPSGAPAGPFAVLLHGSSGDSKLWHDDRWFALAARLAGAGLRAVVPWGSDGERERSLRIADAGAPTAWVPPARLGLAQLASLLARAVVTVGVDTGLTHLAALAGSPTVGIFVASDPELTGVTAIASAAVNLGSRDRAPSLDEVVAAVDAIARPPRC